MVGPTPPQRASGAGDSRGHGGLGYDRILQPLLLDQIHQDKDREESLVRASELDWTIVRPGFLEVGASTARYRVIGNLAGLRSGSITHATEACAITPSSALNLIHRRSTTTQLRLTGPICRVAKFFCAMSNP